MLLAQKIILPGNVAIEGPSGFLFADATLAGVVSKSLVLVFPIAGLLLFAYLVWGGFDFLTSMGDPKKAEAGKHKITNAVIGFLLIFAAYWIVQLVDYFFHFGVYT
jgi:hypothetical protein